MGPFDEHDDVAPGRHAGKQGLVQRGDEVAEVEVARGIAEFGEHGAEYLVFGDPGVEDKGGVPGAVGRVQRVAAGSGFAATALADEDNKPLWGGEAVGRWLSAS